MNLWGSHALFKKGGNLPSRGHYFFVFNCPDIQQTVVMEACLWLPGSEAVCVAEIKKALTGLFCDVKAATGLTETTADAVLRHYLIDIRIELIHCTVIQHVGGA